MQKREAGFTLIELIMVIVIVGVIASILVISFKPAFDSYLAVTRRARLTDLADTAMRKMTRDIRLAVPNSIRLATSQCVEFIPTSTGGRYRTKPDTVWDAVQPGNPSKPIDTSDTVSEFDVVTALTAVPVAGDWVVIDNQNTNDVYSGTNRAAIESVGIPPVASPSLGLHRITLTAATQFPVGYDGGRFSIVPNAQQAVFYVCDNPGLDASGDGTGKVYRFSAYGFNADNPSACPKPLAATPVLADHVESCSFIYAANQGATQQSGFVEVQFKFTQKDESVSLQYGTHVDNVP
jgi:MSHA biogenesis protein MshO